MKLLTTTIFDKNGKTKEITVCVDEQTAEVLAQCREEIRHIYILEE